MTFNEFIAWWNATQSHRIDGERPDFHAFVRESTQADLDKESWCRYWSWFCLTQDYADEKVQREQWEFERQMGLAY